jgi:membrane-associated protease RseP (regulator of RpoE activity)
MLGMLSMSDDNCVEVNGHVSKKKPEAKKGSIRRSLSWNKKSKRSSRKAAAAAAAAEEPITTEVYAVCIDRDQADFEIGVELHAGTGDVIICYVGPTIDGISIGDALLAVNKQPVHGDQFYDGGEATVEDNLYVARYLLRQSATPTVELTVEKNTLRTEVLTRRAALRGTSLDKLGMILMSRDGHVVVNEVEGLAAKSGRIVPGDRIVSVNGERCADLNHAVSLLTAATADEVVLEFTYGFLVPDEHEFDAVSGTYMPKPEKPASMAGTIKRSLSFGKKNRKSKAAGGATPRGGGDVGAAAAADSGAGGSEDEPVQTEENFEQRGIKVTKNSEGRICVTFKVHRVTGELFIGQVGDDSPASHAGLKVGDRVLAMGSKATGGEYFKQGGQADLELARQVLVAAEHEKTIDFLVAQQVRTEVIQFGQKELGAPRDYLGLSFYSCEGDNMVRITKITGPAEKSGRLSLGDRIYSVNGIRVNVAKVLSEHIARIARTDSFIEFEVALGWQACEGLWYGAEGADGDKEGAAPRKVKRSFSFGRKPRF